MATAQEGSTISFAFRMGLRGFHFYRNSVGWVPTKGQSVHLRTEQNNKHDRFAVAGQARIPGKFGRVTVGHVPRELSRYIWHALLQGCKFDASVKNPYHKRSPLTQGGLEIELEVNVWWSDERKCKILETYVTKDAYPEHGYVDDSKAILNEIIENSPGEAETSDDDIAFEADDNSAVYEKDASSSTVTHTIDDSDSNSSTECDVSFVPSMAYQ